MSGVLPTPEPPGGPTLWTVTGRPDTTRMGAEIAAVLSGYSVELLSQFGRNAETQCPPVERLPRSPAELVPGDPDALSDLATRVASSGHALTPTSEPTRPTETQKFAGTAEEFGALAAAYLGLARSLETLQSRARDVYALAEQKRLAVSLVADARAVRAHLARHPEDRVDVEGTLRTAIDLRLAWVDAHQDFIDAVKPIGAAHDLAWV